MCQYSEIANLLIKSYGRQQLAAVDDNEGVCGGIGEMAVCGAAVVAGKPDAAAILLTTGTNIKIPPVMMMLIAPPLMNANTPIPHRWRWGWLLQRREGGECSRDGHLTFSNNGDGRPPSMDDIKFTTNTNIFNQCTWSCCTSNYVIQSQLPHRNVLAQELAIEATAHDGVEISLWRSGGVMACALPLQDHIGNDVYDCNVLNLSTGSHCKLATMCCSALFGGESKAAA